jgi:hypothetical protein
MQAVGSLFSGLSSSVSSAVSGVTGATGATGAAGANSSKKNNSKVTGLGSNIAAGNTHVNNPTATGGMGTPSQKGGRCWSKKNRNRKNKSKKNRNRKNKSNKNRSSRNRK